MQRAPLNFEVAEAPKNGAAYWLRTDDNVRIRVGLWQPKANRYGTVFFFTGRSEYIEKYGRTIEDFLSAGFATYIIDWRGQGLSDRLTNSQRKGHIHKFSDFQKDVAAIVESAKRLDLPKPWFLVGNSMGCTIGLRSIMEDLPVAACVFLSPMWSIRLSAVERFIARPLSWTFRALGQGEAYTPGRKDQFYALSVDYANNELTNDADMFQYYKDQAEAIPEAQLASPTMGWLYESLTECKYLASKPSPNIPCLTFYGLNDTIVDFKAAETRMKNWQNGKLDIIGEGMHDLLCNKPEIRNYVRDRLVDFFISKF